MSGGSREDPREAGSGGPADGVWAAADALFDALLDLPEGEQRARLAASDAPEAVVARVRRLLDLDARTDGFFADRPGTGRLGLEVPLEALAPLEAAVREDLPSGTTIGRYRVTGVLGRGGTSTVYRAERADGAFEQEVAIKVVRSDLDPEALARRMRAERQILASLSHPNLAKVFDGGVTDDGRPWLGVELVEGTRIDAWADQRQLTVRARIELFTQVLAAVQHAHRNLVVHRDLKPSNILVTDDGVVKLLDFGVAKLLAATDDADATEGGDETRAADGRWMTPAYAAPEQIMGEPVTTATDIHQLGVILYELLAGVRPFRGDGAAGSSVQREICETRPTTPSAALTIATETGADPSEIVRARATTPTELRRSLGGDLDAILLKALEKAPEDRYASAEAFADDLRRHLEGLPVLARGDAAAYRIGAFLRRHRVPAAAAALLFLTVSVSAVALALSRGQLVEARADAQAEAAEAQAVVDFLADVFRGRSPDAAPSDTVTAAELVAWGEQRVEQAYGDRPDIRVQLLAVLGDAWRNLGLFDRALEVHRRSLALRREAFGDSSPETVDALVDIAWTHITARSLDAALDPATRALELADELWGANDVRAAEALGAYGAAILEQGAADSAIVVFERAAELQRAAGLDTTQYHIEVLEGIARAHRRAGDLDQAEAAYGPLLSLVRARRPLDRDMLARHLNNFAFVYSSAGDLAGADSLLAESLGYTRDVYGPGHPRTVLITDNRAGLLQSMGREEEAEALLTGLLEPVESLLGPGHWRVGLVWAQVGGLQAWQGAYGDAAVSLARAVEIYQSALGADHDRTVFEAAEAEAARRAAGLTDERVALSAALDRARGWHRAEGPITDAEHANFVGRLVVHLGRVGEAEAAEPFAELLPPDARPD